MFGNEGFEEEDEEFGVDDDNLPHPDEDQPPAKEYEEDNEIGHQSNLERFLEL